MIMWVLIANFVLNALAFVMADFRTEHRELSLVRPYFAGRSFRSNWDFSGSTLVTDDYIRLTPDIQSKSGRLWTKHPNVMKNWEIVVQFKVHGKGTTLFGDGFVIWYTKERMTEGPVFGSMNNFHGLAIFLDTYSNHNGPHNHEHPYISAMVNNGSLEYDHDRDGTHTQLAGCEAKFRQLDHDTFISVKYEKNVLSVSTDIENQLNWKLCSSVAGVRLPTNYYFGFSASTGDLSDYHDVISFKIYDIPTDDSLDYSNIVPSAERFEAPRERLDDVKSSRWSALKIFLVVFVSIIVLIVITIAAIIYYQNNHGRNMKRFY